jgi:hypothetical protein
LLPSEVNECNGELRQSQTNELLAAPLGYNTIAMQGSTQLRRTELIEGVRRHRRVLWSLNFARERAPEIKERAAIQIQEFTQELNKLEAELHDLNVRQIRKEQSGG